MKYCAEVIEKEKYFIVSNHDFLKSVRRDKAIKQSRNDFIKNFFAEHGIDGTGYYLGGAGWDNRPFFERDKKNIYLHIDNTQANLDKFGKQLRKSDLEGMVCFKKNSEILKKFQSACIESGIVINRMETRPGHYFKELDLGGYSSQRFMLDDKIYLKISTDGYKDKMITPKYDGFDEIQAVEYYHALEKIMVRVGDKR